jgi:hypothetical protein
VGEDGGEVDGEGVGGELGMGGLVSQGGGDGG